MTGLNKVMLIGRVGKDPDIFTFDNGNKKLSLVLATNESYKDKSGNWIELTEWHNIAGYGYLADKNIVKGDLVYVEGKIKTRKWQDKDGNDRYTTEIVAEKINLLVKAGYQQNSDSSNQSKPEETVDKEGLKEGLPGNDNDKPEDDLPF